MRNLEGSSMAHRKIYNGSLGWSGMPFPLTQLLGFVLGQVEKGTVCPRFYCLCALQTTTNS